MQAILMSVAVGMAAVFQGGLNRMLAQKWGLPTAVFINATLLLAYSGGFFLYHYRSLDLTGFKFQWWFLIPAFFGFSLITGIPWCIAQIGALRVFLCVVVGQMILSMGWDYFYEEIGINAFRVSGALLAIVGLVVANWRG